MSAMHQDNRILKAFFVVIAAAAILSFIAILSYYINRSIDWRSHFAQTVSFGQHCEYAQASSDKVSLADVGKLRFQSRSMPLRDDNNPVRTYPGTTLVIRCDLPTIAESTGGVSVNLGYFYGASSVYLNEVLKFRTHGERMLVEFPLLETDLASKGKLTIVSIGVSDGFAGPVTLIPFHVALNDEQRTAVNNYLYGFYPQLNMLRIGFASAVLIMLIILWIYGMRYDDILWFSTLSSSVMLASISIWLPFAGISELASHRLEAGANFAAGIASAAFLLTHMRPGIHWINRLSLGSIIFMATVAMLIPAEWLYEYKLRKVTPTWVNFALMIGVLVFVRSKSRRESNPALKSRASYSSVMAFTILLLCFIQALTNVAKGWDLLTYVQIAVLVTFSSGLIRALAKRQHEYFVERDLRIHQEAAAERATLVAQTAQMISHDLRRPFGLAQVLREELKHAKEERNKLQLVDEYLAKFLASAEQSSELLTDLMRIGRKAPNDITVSEKISLRTTLAHILSDMPNRHPTLSINISFEMDELKMVAGEQRGLRRVLQNVIDNAIEAMTGKGTLTFRSSTLASGYVSFEIINNGPMIPKDKWQRIFDFQYTSGKRHGNGLGLASARQLMMELGGTIECASSSEHQTIFLLTLRSVDEQDLSQAPLPSILTSNTQQKSEPVSSPQLVIIDDDDLILRAWQRRLGNEISVKTYQNVDLFIQEMKSWKDVQTVVTDFHFDHSRHDGHDIAEKAKNIWPDVLVLVSSYQEFSEATKSAYVDAYISKSPLSWQDLNNLHSTKR
jgi:signal transduction histidine kinase